MVDSRPALYHKGFSIAQAPKDLDMLIYIYCDTFCTVVFVYFAQCNKNFNFYVKHDLTFALLHDMQLLAFFHEHEAVFQFFCDA